MNCEHCKRELHIANVYRMVDGRMTIQPGAECRFCGAIYDENGVQLEPPFSQRDPEEDDESDGE